MPIYKYKCKKCGEKFEAFRSMNSSDDDLKCPKCSTNKPKKLLSAFSAKNFINSCFPTGGG